MAQYQSKTQQTSENVELFLDSVADVVRQKDAKVVVDLIAKVTGEPPVMWGGSIVGFGTYRYKYASGREGDWMRIGLSPRKQNLVIYIMDGFKDYQKLLGALGPHTTGKACLYIKRLDDIDMGVLKQIIAASWKHGKPIGTAGSSY